MRGYKTVSDTYIEPISFTVPRRAETFQSDIFPPATGLKPAVSAKEWFDGKTGIPSKIDLESVYEGNAPVEIPSDYKPPAAAADAVAPSPAPTPKPAPKKEPEPAPVAVSRAPPPSMSEQKNSMSALANKFQDDEEEEEDDDAETSSFEEVARPTRTHKPPSPIKATPPVVAESPVKSPPLPRVVPSDVSSGASVEASLEQIKQLLEQQSKIIGAQSDKINAQSDKIGHLATEVEVLKKRVGSAGSQDQSERIRQLELELEAARS